MESKGIRSENELPQHSRDPAHRIMESPELVGTHKDHQGHELDLHKTSPKSHRVGAFSKCPLSSGHLAAMTTALVVSWASLEPCVESGSGVFHGALGAGGLKAAVGRLG